MSDVLDKLEINIQENEVLTIYNVDIQWEEEGRVWLATSKDVKGMVLISGSFDALLLLTEIHIPELIATPKKYKINFSVKNVERISFNG